MLSTVYRSYKLLSTVNHLKECALGVHLMWKQAFMPLLTHLIPFISDALLELISTSNLVSINPFLHKEYLSYSFKIRSF